MATRSAASRRYTRPARLVTAPEPPPLEGGDRLTRREFERRYKAMPGLKKAELIEGVVYMPSPVRATHGQPHGQIMTWLGLYCVSTPGIALYDNTTVRLDADNEPQPDALLRIEPECGGRSRISDDDYIEGPPELIIEIAASSASYDLHDKLNAYRRNEIQEYMVWRIYDRLIDWWELREGAYVPIAPDQEGVIRSEVFPGLWLATPSLLEGKMTDVLAILHQGLESERHAAFVAHLAKSGAS